MAVLSSFGITSSPVGAIVFLVSSSVLITLSLAIYRIYYHPLSRFPGPKLAAASRWYEAYYDLCYGMGGQYTAEIRRMHEKYGPIVRIGPNEVSISDPDFHEVVYAPAPAVRNKIPMIANILGTTAGTFGSMDHYVHRKRRAATSRFFSVDNIAKAEPIIREHVERFCTRLQQGQAVATVWEVRVQFMALKLDIFYDFAFADSLKLQQNPEEALAWDGTMEAIAICAPWVKMFPWILPIAVKLNPTMVHAVWPAVARVLRLNHRIYKQAEVSAIDPKGFVDEKTGDQRPAPLFQTLLESNLPDQEKNTWRMSQEGSEMFAASGTTARVMSACMFYLHERPETLKLLQQELDERIPNPNRIPALKTFESFTYMQAVIRESLRMAAPVATRLPLVAPSVIEYDDWCIPAGTPVSVNQRDLLHNPAIYNDPFTFKPERWLATGKDVIPERFFVPFNKGTRMCLGRDFAMAELQTTIAYLIRRFDFQLVNTTREKDVEVVRDCFLSEPRPGSRGVKVRVVDKPTAGRERLVNHFSVDSSQHASKWDALWAEKFIPWDQGSAHPALIDALSNGSGLLGSPVIKDSSGTERRKRALVPGCGKGYDVLVFASFGYDAWGLEVSETAIKACEEFKKETEDADGYQVRNQDVGKGSVNFIHGDFYGTEWQGEASDHFDVIYDYTFLCAMPPDKRPEWALRMSQLLSPEGRLICIEFPTYNRPAVGGPPWAVRKETYLEHLKRPGEKIPYDEDSFVVVEDAQANSDALKRIAHWKPEKTHPLGVGTDWVSVWEHI